jgi:tetratricopeptide (TPR) repeat protein
MRTLLLLSLFLRTFQCLAQQPLAGEPQLDSLIIVTQYDKALTLIDELKHSQAGPSVGYLLNKQAEVQIAQGQLESAAQTIQELQKLEALDKRSEGMLLTNQGSYQMNLGRYDLALEHLSQAYGILQQGSHVADLARCVGLISLTYVATGKYNLAEENAQVALQLRREHYGDSHEAVAASYNDLGLVYTSIDQDKALEFYEQALEVYKKLHGSTHSKIAIASTNIGILYREIELYGDAVNNLEAALAIWKSTYPAGHPNEAFVHRNLGQTYFAMGNTGTALKYFQQALDLYRKFYGNKHPEISSTLNQIGVARLQEFHYEAALADFQEAICANVPSFNQKQIRINPPISEYYNGIVLLYSLRLKAQGLEDLHFGKTLSMNELKLAQSTLYLCDSLIDIIRHESTDEADKISLGSLASEVYEDGVRVSIALSEIALKPRAFRESAFYFGEKSKSAVLQESIADTQAKSFAGIPAETVDQEKNLKSSIALLSQKLSQKPTPEEEKYLRESLISLKHEYASFTQQLEKSYPEYYNLKFNVASPSVLQLQMLLKEDEAIVSYFVATRGQRLYQFILTRMDFKSHSAPIPPEFERSTRGFNNGIFYRDFSAYQKSSSILYKVLKPRVPSRIRELIIVPAGRLGTLPFEALATNTNDAEGFESLHFLIDRFAISYEFSTGLIAQKSKNDLAASPSILLCAPVDFPPNDELESLPATEQEVREISALFTGSTKKVITHQEANEAAVKSKTLSDYNLLHFATHGIVDEVDPERSRIFLNENAGEDGELYASEIYNLSMNADLAVLSACQTGLGKYSEGEGVIGLSRALVYAGARNLVVSFWSVADESTARLMTDFYADLVNDKTKSFRESLRRAKIKMINDKNYAAPYYWAPFILIGF